MLNLRGEKTDNIQYKDKK